MHMYTFGRLARAKYPAHHPATRTSVEDSLHSVRLRRAELQHGGNHREQRFPLAHLLGGHKLEYHILQVRETLRGSFPLLVGVGRGAAAVVTSGAARGETEATELGLARVASAHLADLLLEGGVLVHQELAVCLQVVASLLKLLQAELPCDAILRVLVVEHVQLLTEGGIGQRIRRL